MPDLHITLIQTFIHWENTGANLRMLEEKMNHVPEGTELVILPEMFSTGFSMHVAGLAEKPDGATTQWMKETAKREKVIVAGSIIIEENGQYYNRLIWMYPNGRYAWYDKRHLFAYAGEDQYYSRGNKKLILRVNGWKISPVICYDLRFPVWLRQPPDIQSHYDLLICVANWPESRAHAWDTLLRARAIENQCFVAGVNRTGVDGNQITHAGGSCVIDPMGKILIQKMKEEVIISYTLQKDSLLNTRKHFPFLRDADKFLIQK